MLPPGSSSRCGLLRVLLRLLQIEDNFGCLAVVPKLTPEVMERIEKVIQSRPDAASSFR